MIMCHLRCHEACSKRGVLTIWAASVIDAMGTNKHLRVHDITGLMSFEGSHCRFTSFERDD